MSKILLVPDVHGREFWKKVKNYEGEIVFLGDYLDPYGFEFDPNGKTEFLYEGKKVRFNYMPDRRESSIINLEEIIDFANSRDNVTLLLGNHDYHYLYPGLNASRQDVKRYPEINKLFNKNLGLFKGFYTKDNLLCTHAGVTQEWISYNFDDTTSFQEALETSTYVQKFQTSAYRGGTHRYSGPLWLDVHEIKEDNLHLYTDEDIKYQVFGHTMLPEEGSIFRVDNGACIDSRAIFEIDTEDPENTLKVWEEES